MTHRLSRWVAALTDLSMTILNGIFGFDATLAHDFRPKRAAHECGIRSTLSFWVSSGLLTLSLAASGWAQATAPTSAIRPLGVVTAIDTEGKQMTIKTDAGPDITVHLQEGTTFLRVPPGEKDLKNAAKIALSDIGVGDRVLARGRVSDEQKTVLATSVIVMTKADIAKKHEADRAEWQRHGVAGVVTTLDPDKKEITIVTRTPEGTKPLVIALATDAVLRRYAPDSVKFSDAKPSTLAELKIGDQVRALGTKSDDTRRFTAEQLVSGSFRNLAGTVISVNSSANTIKVTDLESKKPLLVRVNADSKLRRLPPMVAQMLARRSANEDGPAGNARERSLAGGGERMRPSGPAASGMTGSGVTPDPQQMLERMPALALADLKPGDAIIIASTVGADPAQVTAITLLAGVEPLLTAPHGGQQMMLSSWSLDMNMSLP